MRATLRIACVAALTVAAMAIAAASASAAPQPVVIQNNGVDCGNFTAGIPGSQFFEGGCELTAHSDSSILTAPTDSADCVVDIPGSTGGGGDGFAHVSTDGDAGINSIDILEGTPNCTQISPCLEPAMPWGGEVVFEDTVSEFQATIDFCVDTPFGTYGGPTVGEITNGVESGGVCVTPPRLTFTTAPVGTSGATLDAVFDLAPNGGDPCDLTIAEA
jgi:hypothetical protein